MSGSGAGLSRKAVSFGAYERLVWEGVPATPDYWGANWDATDLSALIDGIAHDPEVRPLIDRVLTRESRLLEAGCGPAQWVIGLRREGFHAFGVDYAPEPLHVTSRYQPEGTVVACADVSRLPFADATFDIVTSFGVVEHFWSGPEPFLREMTRVMKPGGTMFVSVPYHNRLRKWRSGRAKTTPPASPPPDFYQFAFERREFVALLRACGLTVERAVGVGAVKGIKDDVPFLASLRRELLNAPVPAAAAPSAGPSRPKPRLSLRRIVRGTLLRVARAPLVTRFSGHMLLAVCRKT